MIIVIYVLIFFILIFVAIIGFKAAGAGIEAKKRNKSDVHIRKKNISKDLSRLNKLYRSGGITKKEFQKAKNKVLKN